MTDNNTEQVVEIFIGAESFCTDLVDIITNTSTESLMVFKNSVINSLDRWIPDKKTGYFFTKSAFEESLNKWDKAPIIFAKAHPNLTDFTRDPEKALTKVGGRIVGYAENPRIVIEGHPRLLETLSVNDIEAIELWKKGKLSLSSAFLAYINNERKITRIDSVNHILLFEEDENNTPRDKSVIVNKEDIMTSTEKQVESPSTDSNFRNQVLSFINMVKAKLGDGAGQCTHSLNDASLHSLSDSSLSITIVPQQNTKSNGDIMTDTKIETLNKELEVKEQTIVSLNKELETNKKLIAERDAQIASLNEKIKIFEQKEKDLKFQAFLNNIKKGAYDTKEKLDALRNKFETDPQTLMIELASTNMFMTKVESKEVGFEHIAEAENMDDIDNGLDFDPVTKQWK